MTRLSVAGLVVALLAAKPAADLLAEDGQRGRGAGGSAVDPPSRYVIAGHVGDQAKRPVAGAFVTALLPSRTPNQPFTLVSARLRTTTDAHGNFRLEGLYPADFYVVVLPHNPPLDKSGRPNRDGYANTFYPSALNTTSAKLVRVNTGVTAVAEITVRSARLSTVSGVVISSKGQPVRGGILSLAHGDRLFGLDSRLLEIGATGAFTTPGLQPGTYFLQYHESQWPPPRGETPTVSQAKVVVRDADVANVRVSPIKLVIATGHVVVSPEDRDELLAEADRDRHDAGQSRRQPRPGSAGSRARRSLVRSRRVAGSAPHPVGRAVTGLVRQSRARARRDDAESDGGLHGRTGDHRARGGDCEKEST